LAKRLVEPVSALEKAVESAKFQRTKYYQTDKGIFLASTEKHRQLQKKILATLALLDKPEMIDKKGFTASEIRGKIKEEAESAFIELILQDLAQAGKAEEAEGRWRLKNRKAVFSKKQEKLLPILEGIIQKSGVKVLTLAEIAERVPGEFSENEKEIERLLRHLTQQKSVVFMDKFYFDAGILAAARQQLQAYLEAHSEGITVAQFRDLIHGNRKICLLLLNFFDEEGVTIRRENVRVLAASS